MGHRANLVIVDESGYQLYYCHWCAKYIPASLFWGPEIALEFIRQQRSIDIDKTGWLDIVWAEGGALVDVHRQQALLYGGGFIHNIPLRRLYMALVQQVWTGWIIQWASDGIFSMASYVGLPLEVVCKPMEKPRGKCELPAPGEMGWVDIIGSIKRQDGTIDFFPTEGMLEYTLPHGPSLVTKVMHRDTLQTEYQCDELPQSGFHIDETTKTLSYWMSDEERIREEELSPLWPDWDVVPLHDDFEAHIQLTDGRLKVTLTPEEELLSQLKSMLLSQPENLAENFLDIVGHLEEEGKNVEINSYALRDDPLQLAEEQRQKILDEAIKAWRKSKGD